MLCIRYLSANIRDEAQPNPIFFFAPPGTSLKMSDRLASSIEKSLLGVEGVKSVTRRTGRAERDEHAEPVSTSEIEVTVVRGSDKDEVREQITRILEQRMRAERDREVGS